MKNITIKNSKKFPFKANDVLSFPDTDTETVDVGIGVEIPIAQTSFENLIRVIKKGKGLTLQLVDTEWYNYSEVFRRGKKTINSGYISLKEYIDYFGNFDDLKFVCSWNDYNALKKTNND